MILMILQQIYMKPMKMSKKGKEEINHVLKEFLQDCKFRKYL